jgi:hypothetical protein
MESEIVRFCQAFSVTVISTTTDTKESAAMHSDVTIAV